MTAPAEFSEEADSAARSSVAPNDEPVSSLPIEITSSAHQSDGQLEVIATRLISSKFCGKCGTPWRSEWTICESCAHRALNVPVLLDITYEHRAIKSSVALYFTLLGVCVIGLICANPSNAFSVDLGVIIGLSVVTLVWCAISWRSILPPLTKLPHPGWFGAAMAISLITFGVAAAVINTFKHAIHLPSINMSDPFLKAGYGWVFIVLCVCVQPAIIEELAFRGFIFGALRKALSPIETIVVSAMMFMILHLSVIRFPHTFALGVAAGYLRTRTRSLYPCILMHFSHNFLCVAVEWAMRSTGS